MKKKITYMQSEWSLNNGLYSYKSLYNENYKRIYGEFNTAREIIFSI